MATVEYTFVRRCAGGCHATFDISINGGAARQRTFDTDVLRASLASMTDEEVEAALTTVLRVHIAGKTRAQIVSEFQNPVTVTI